LNRPLFAYLVEAPLPVSICDDLNRSFCAFGDIQARRNADIAQAEVAKARDLELRVQHCAEAAIRVVANGEVNSDVGLLVTQFQLDRPAADREVGALRLHAIVASARVSRFLVLIKPTRCRVVEIEMGESDRSKRERKDRLGQHGGVREPMDWGWIGVLGRYSPRCARGMK
jgi:hypothetical protein